LTQSVTAVKCRLVDILTVTHAVSYTLWLNNTLSYMYGIQGGSVFSSACLYARNDDELSMR